MAIGGCTLSRTPMAMVWALIRAGKKDLTVSRSITSTEGDLFYGSGVSRHIMTSWFSQGIVWGVSKVMRHYTETKQATFEEWSHMAMGLRYRAGAMGVPFMPTRTMMASDVGGRIDQTTEMNCPLYGRESVAGARAQPRRGADPCAALRPVWQRPDGRAAFHGCRYRHGRQ